MQITALDAIPSKLLEGTGARFTTTSLTLAASTSFASLCEVTKSVLALQDASLWWVGDLVNFCREKYKSQYAQLAEILGYERQSLVNIAFVCTHIPAEDRVPDVSFTLHREVVEIPRDKRIVLLEQARLGKWSVRQLRNAVRLDSSEYAQEHATASKDKEQLFNVVAWSSEGMRWFKKELEKKPVTEWSPERKKALLRDLQPFVKLHELLRNGNQK